MSRVADILERNNAKHRVAETLKAEAGDALTAEMLQRAEARDRNQFFKVDVKFRHGAYELIVQIPSAATGTRDHQAALEIVADLDEKKTGSFRTKDIDFPHGRPKKGALAVHTFRAENPADIVATVNAVLSLEIPKISQELSHGQSR